MLDAQQHLHTSLASVPPDPHPRNTCPFLTSHMPHPATRLPSHRRHPRLPSTIHQPSIIRSSIRRPSIHHSQSAVHPFAHPSTHRPRRGINQPPPNRVSSRGRAKYRRLQFRQPRPRSYRSQQMRPEHGAKPGKPAGAACHVDGPGLGVGSRWVGAMSRRTIVYRSMA
jgi:hypothetical protein